MRMRIPFTRRMIVVGWTQKAWPRNTDFWWNKYLWQLNFASTFLAFAFSVKGLSAFVRVGRLYLSSYKVFSYEKKRSKQSKHELLEERVQYTEHDVEWLSIDMTDLEWRMARLEDALENAGVDVYEQERLLDYGDLLPADSWR